MGDGEVQGMGELGKQGIAPPFGKSWIMKLVHWNRRRRRARKKTSSL